MKSVMISIRPQWCELIESGEKTIEVRKNRPKLNTPLKCYIYCTNADYYSWGLAVQNVPIPFGEKYAGKVVGEFVCDKITNLFAESRFWLDENIVEQTCLTGKQIREYANGKDFIYGWHISNLKIYDRPKELSEFTGRRKTRFGIENFKMKRPPQSWCYVEEVDSE